MRRAGGGRGDPPAPFPATGARPDPPGSPPALKTYSPDPVGRTLVTNRGGRTIPFFIARRGAVRSSVLKTYADDPDRRVNGTTGGGIGASIARKNRGTITGSGKPVFRTGIACKVYAPFYCAGPKNSFSRSCYASTL